MVVNSFWKLSCWDFKLCLDELVILVPQFGVAFVLAGEDKA